jgi:tRNA pseudouridine32 synthase/23S rRNA pseudouridine746 synthase
VTPPKDPFLFAFEMPIDALLLPGRFVLPSAKPHPVSIAAAHELQHYLQTQEWDHNFGLAEGKGGTIIGKMFGVLVVRTQEDKVGYLAAFSGKLAGGNHHTHFVPPVFDTLSENGFLNEGMKELTRINSEIKRLEEHREQINLLKTTRKNYSASLQRQIFGSYHFLNGAGEVKSLYTVFREASYPDPPAGAGECAAPKLLQYAFQNRMQPLVLAEFWWGLSPKSDQWKHGHFYPPCREKCGPILAHMLEGID